MQRPDVLALLLTLYEEQGGEQLCHILERLGYMCLSNYLSIEETLMLLTKIAKGRKG